MVCRSDSQIRAVCKYNTRGEELDKAPSTHILKVDEQDRSKSYLNCKVLVNGKPLFMITDTGACFHIE